MRVGARFLDQALAWYLSEHIMNGYEFLMQNYHEGDSVCIFGWCQWFGTVMKQAA